MESIPFGTKSTSSLKLYLWLAGLAVLGKTMGSAASGTKLGITSNLVYTHGRYREIFSCPTTRRYRRTSGTTLACPSLARSTHTSHSSTIVLSLGLLLDFQPCRSGGGSSNGFADARTLFLILE